MNIFEYLNPEVILLQGGLWLVILIVFLESGFFFGFFLPGDSLLFTAGLLCGTGIFAVPVEILASALCIAAILGYIVGYFTGKIFGGAIRKDNRYIKPKHLHSTEAFYARHGIKAIVLGRFIPIVRTFAPILSGMVLAPFGKFMVYNISGAIIWVVILVFIGFWLGNSYPGLRDYLEFIVVGIIIVTMLPAISNIIKKRLSKTY